MQYSKNILQAGLTFILVISAIVFLNTENTAQDLKAAAPDVPMETIIRSVLWFIPADLTLLLLLYFMPQLALWLPSLIFD